MSGTNPLDYNGADAQSAAFDLLPAGTLVRVRLTIRPGGAGPEGWLTQSRTSEAQYLNTEAVVLEGPHARRRIYTRIGIRGKGGQGADDTYANRGRALIRGILESARGVEAKDTSERARAARTIRGYGDLNGLEFLAKVGVEKDQKDPRDEGRNVVAAAIGPEHAEYARLMGGGASAGVATPPALPAAAASAAPPWAAAQPPQPAATAAGAGAPPFWAR
ncbi:hypothetical protein GCM10010964_28550 [Caldovatus sediminis]|uniref:Uncharacterized protein n=1 Tax=Caldovatus sediminis TaxID=2041189 RepID=A0A8J3ED43_9PROT|nr:hypothetical protein [Caldovatus sediminis]GGG39286.1 hypothetical protein GCM10010964_28550 [Caldovatus sediminis]